MVHIPFSPGRPISVDPVEYLKVALACALYMQDHAYRAAQAQLRAVQEVQKVLLGPWLSPE